MTHAYEKDGLAIYRQSFSIIRAEADLSAFDETEAHVAVRMIHSCGMVDLTSDIRFAPGAVDTAMAALRAGAPILCDAEMVRSGVTRTRLPAANEVICALRDPQVRSLAEKMGTTRSAAAFELMRGRLAGAVVAIGNAPTALFHLLNMLEREPELRPAAILGMPVGFVGAAESKDALAATDLPYLVVLGRRGGSAITCGALNALASDAL